MNFEFLTMFDGCVNDANNGKKRIYYLHYDLKMSERCSFSTSECKKKKTETYIKMSYKFTLPTSQWKRLTAWWYIDSNDEINNEMVKMNMCYSTKR